MTVVEVNPKAPFSIATKVRCTLVTYLIKLSVMQGGMKYHFCVFGMTRPGIEARSPRPLAKTVPIRSMDRSSVLILKRIV